MSFLDPSPNLNPNLKPCHQKPKLTLSVPSVSNLSNLASDPSTSVERSLDTNQSLPSPTGPRGLIMPPKFKGPTPKLPICQTPEMVTVPKNLDTHTTITINDQQLDIEADDLEVICELGEFCQDIWLQLINYICRVIDNLCSFHFTKQCTIC